MPPCPLARNLTLSVLRNPSFPDSFRGYPRPGSYLSPALPPTCTPKTSLPSLRTPGMCTLAAPRSPARGLTSSGVRRAESTRGQRGCWDTQPQSPYSAASQGSPLIALRSHLLIHTLFVSLSLMVSLPRTISLPLTLSLSLQSHLLSPRLWRSNLLSLPVSPSLLLSSAAPPPHFGCQLTPLSVVTPTSNLCTPLTPALPSRPTSPPASKKFPQCPQPHVCS